MQQTTLWDAGSGTVRPARSKEESHDYRYFPKPDLPPLRLTSDCLASVRADLPELPAARRQRFVASFNLPAYDAEVLRATRDLADYFEAVDVTGAEAKVAANWVMGEVLARLKDAGIGIRALAARPAQLGVLLSMVRDGAVSHSAAKAIFAQMAKSGEDTAVIADREGLCQVGDDGQLRAWIGGCWRRIPTRRGGIWRGTRSSRASWWGW